MPHKHKRRGDADKSFFDLPPSTRAKPLPVKTSQASIFESKKANIKRKQTKDVSDDTPKQFARLMRWNNEGVKLPKGLDDGNDRQPSKKRKRGEDNVSTAKVVETKSEAPKILPGERLSDFAARVDQALPLSSLASLNSRKDGKPLDPALAKSLKGRPTKHNKRLLQMQKEWREEEKRRKAKREEAAEEDEEKNEQDGLLWDGVGASTSKKKRNGGSFVTRLEGSDDDPWAELTKQQREATKQKNLQDVVQAPPQLDHRKAIGKGRIFRDIAVDIENVPASVGSLRKREEIASKRREFIEQYRQKRGGKWENREFVSESD